MTPEQHDADLVKALNNLGWLATDGRPNPQALELVEAHRLASQPVPAPDLVERACKAGAEFSGFTWPEDYDEGQRLVIRAVNKAILSAIIPIAREESDIAGAVEHLSHSAKATGLSVRKLAKLAGVSPATCHRIMRGECLTTPPMIKVETAIRERNGG